MEPIPSAVPPPVPTAVEPSATPVPPQAITAASTENNVIATVGTSSAPEVTTTTVAATSPQAATAALTNNTIWSKTIKTVNYIFLAICLGFLLIIDLPILLKTPSLAPFFYAMLMALGLFVGCLLFELWAGKRLQNTSHSGLDTTIFVLAIIRNVIIVLNVIPLIQIIGFLISPLALLFILANAIMITIRLKQKPTLLY